LQDAAAECVGFYCDVWFVMGRPSGAKKPGIHDHYPEYGCRTASGRPGMTPTEINFEHYVGPIKGSPVLALHIISTLNGELFGMLLCLMASSR